MRSSENVFYALRIISKVSIKRKISFVQSNEEHLLEFKEKIVREKKIGFLAKNCRFLVETFKTFKSKLSVLLINKMNL